MPPFPRLLVGYDGSPWSRAALHYAARRAAGSGEVLVAHVVEEPPAGLSARAREALTADHVGRGQAVLDAIALTGFEDLIDDEWTTEVLAGPPAAALLEYAVEEDVDEIVVGSHGTGRLGELIGSVAHELIRRADRPVVVIPAGAVEGSGDG